MRRGERRRGRDVAAGGADATAARAVAVSWHDLPEAERTALKRMNRGPYAGLTEDLGRRLVALGLAVARPGGIGISRAGRELVINALLTRGDE